MTDFIVCFLLYAGFDLILYKCGKDVPGVNIGYNLKSSYFWYYRIIRLVVVTILFFLIKGNI